ncbi:NAD-dependent epimerase/dehydratase family protein [Deinococcus caeni]|uniref:NAD-dependent epimerase/dehydratase domain-containing protein n=2 Tax=Deinococcus caeni TaxID=569127 RepID=A0ABP9UDK2_9DEIO
MMTILVTGATGFLGGVTARELARTGQAVTGLGRDAHRGAALEADGVRFMAADLRGADWDALLRGVEGVVHAAARSTLWGHAADFHADNVAPSAALARACAVRGVRLVHVSTPSGWWRVSGGDGHASHAILRPRAVRPARCAHDGLRGDDARLQGSPLRGAVAVGD